MKVRIQNFQSIKDVEFEVEGFTAIVGPSSIGKSALWRALNYPFHNRLGEEFVRLGENAARVEVEDDDFKMVWEKGSGGATYYFNDDPVPVEKIERGVIPQQILDAGWADVLLKDGKGKVKQRISAQFAPQKDGNVFLLDENPSTVAEVLAQLSRLDVLMKAARATETDIRRVKSKLKIRAEDEQRLQAKLDGYDGLQEAQNEVQELRTVAAGLREADAKVEAVAALQKKWQLACSTIEILQPLREAEVPATLEPDVWQVWKRAEDLAARLSKAVAVGQALAAVQDAEVPSLPEEDTYEKVLVLARKHGLAEAVLSQSVPEVPDLPDTRLWDQAEALHRAVQEQEACKVQMQEHSLSVQSQLEELEQELASLEDQMGACPTCGKAFHE